MGQSYLLGCPEGGDARLLEAVERADTAMCKIRDAGKVRARDRIAVLAASKTMIGALGIYRMKAGGRLIMKGAAGPHIAASEIGLALIPRHFSTDHIQYGGARQHFVNKGAVKAGHQTRQWGFKPESSSPQPIASKANFAN
eukprot:gene26070-47273_t